ncbi:MAG: hypothetical protein ABIS28_08270 [Caldimonas sp.]
MPRLGARWNAAGTTTHQFMTNGSERVRVSLGGDDIVETLSQEQWVDRFAMRLAMRDELRHPLELLIEMGNGLWPAFGGIEPEVIADAEYRAGMRR